MDAERVHSLLELLRSIAEPTRADRGCLGFEVWFGGDEGTRVLLFERWRSREELACHLGSDLYRRVLVAMEMSSSEPVVRFLEVAGEHGMEWIESARSSNASWRRGSD